MGIQRKQWNAVLCKQVGNFAGRMLVNGSFHSSGNGGIKRMSGYFLRPYDQRVDSLAYDDLLWLPLYGPGPQIGGQSIFFSMEINDANDSRETECTQWDIRNGEH